jgi:cytochrome c oxidase cbb3-type subunit 3
LASYVKSLHGTNPPNPKEKQGELYQENATAPAKDSAATEIKADSTK